MKNIPLKVLLYAILSVILVLIPETSNAEDPQKLILVTVDSWGLDELLDIEEPKSVGMISMVARGGSDANESQIMSMAVGRRVELDVDISTSIQVRDEKLWILGYGDILDDLDEEYKDFSKNMPFLGATLHKHSIARAYIGEGSDILLLANREGSIDYGVNEMVYEYGWLSENLEHLLDRADIVHISYDIGEIPQRRELLKELISSRDEAVIVISKSVPEPMIGYLNTTLSPIFLINEQEGILWSDSTRRRGVVSNLDIKPTILERYGLEDSLAIGNSLLVSGSQNPEKELESILSGFLNLGISKYAFHGIIIFIQLISMYTILFKRELLNKIGWILFIPSTILMVSLGTSLSAIYRYWYVYVPLILLIALTVSNYFYKQNFRTIDEIATLTNIAIIALSLVNFNFIYNSFIGYNNIVAGGRFYGFNNDIMGVFIATSILTYYYISDKLKPKNKVFFTAIYLATVMLLNSGAYGNNFGGLLTSAFLGASIVYLEFLNGKIDKKKMAVIGISLVAILAVSIHFIGARGHIGEFFIRVNRYGFTELINMIEVKVRQLLFMAVIPPWSIMVITQSIFATVFIKRQKRSLDKGYRYTVIFATAIFALLVNDTGVVSFVYIMSYFVSMAGLELLQEEG